jgi:RNA polymerase sigma-32 factor
VHPIAAEVRKTGQFPEARPLQNVPDHQGGHAMRIQAGLPDRSPSKLPQGSLMRPRPARRVPVETPEALDPAEELHLHRRWKATQDPRALAELIEPHLGLVQRIANEFRGTGPERDDLVQEGHLGLLTAARRFDPSRSARLATYASYWIRACMMELVVRSHGAVRVGTTRAQRRIFFGLGRARRELERAGGPATTEALAARLGVEQRVLEEMSARLSGRDLSLDAPRKEDGSAVGSSFRSDADTAEDLLCKGEWARLRSDSLRQALAELAPRERQILEARHLGEESPTLAELGVSLGISRERVRQLEARALARLKSRVLH